MFYAISYAMMSAAAFGAIVVLSRQGFEADRIDDFRGLNARNPWLALLVLCVMASLAGVPPFLGFWAKLVVLRRALEGGMMWLAIVGVVFAVIGAFYYLRVIKVMYFDEPVGRCRRRRARTGRCAWCSASMRWRCWCWAWPGARSWRGASARSRG